MSTSSYLQLGTIEALVIRKEIKNLHLSILPPNGRVRITVPERMKDDTIRTLIALRLPWIKKQQAKFKGQARETIREYVSGESHYYFGKRYRLTLIEESDTARVELKGKNRLLLFVRPRSPVSKREEVLSNWYRNELQAIVEVLMQKWQAKLGVKTHHWSIKRMKTRWGTCNPKSKRILLNLELAKKPPSSIEYVVVHELIHLIEKNHNDRFVALMDKNLPKWQHTKDEINRFILSYDTWTY